MPGFHPPLTYFLIAVCFVVGLLTGFGDHFEAVRPFLISNYVGAGLPEVTDGEVWRLITPIFIHFGMLHIALNMLWLWQLGSLIEYADGPWTLFGLTLVTGLVSNLAEFNASGPVFGGMSGVIFALLGYLWVQGKLNPFYRVRLNPKLFTVVMVWFVVCWSGVLELVGIHIANWAHTAGLISGLVGGAATAMLQRMRTNA